VPPSGRGVGREEIAPNMEEHDEARHAAPAKLIRETFQTKSAA
jgi:hypothetical protein